MAKQLDQQYNAYLRQYKQKQKQGYILEPVYSKKTFADVQKQMKTQRMNGSVSDIINSQTKKLSSAERIATKAALDNLEKEWGSMRYSEMSADAADSLNSYFNLSKEQQRNFLRDPKSEEWRSWIFTEFGTFGYYFSLNSPK